MSLHAYAFFEWPLGIVFRITRLWIILLSSSCTDSWLFAAIGNMPFTKKDHPPQSWKLVGWWTSFKTWRKHLFRSRRTCNRKHTNRYTSLSVWLQEVLWLLVYGYKSPSVFKPVTLFLDCGSGQRTVRRLLQESASCQRCTKNPKGTFRRSWCMTFFDEDDLDHLGIVQCPQ